MAIFLIAVLQLQLRFSKKATLLKKSELYEGGFCQLQELKNMIFTFSFIKNDTYRMRTLTILIEIVPH
jgi:hypothetical protein